jgi:hypothetical protein
MQMLENIFSVGALKHLKQGKTRSGKGNLGGFCFSIRPSFLACVGPARFTARVLTPHPSEPLIGKFNPHRFRTFAAN